MVEEKRKSLRENAALIALVLLFGAVTALPLQQAEAVPIGSTYRTVSKCQTHWMGIEYMAKGKICTAIRYWDQSDGKQLASRVRVTWTDYGGNQRAKITVKHGRYSSGTITVRNGRWKSLPQPLAVKRHDAGVRGTVDGPLWYDNKLAVSLWLR